MNEVMAQLQIIHFAGQCTHPLCEKNSEKISTSCLYRLWHKICISSTYTTPESAHREHRQCTHFDYLTGQSLEKNMINDGLNLPRDTVLCYTTPPGHTFPTPLHGLVGAPDMTQTWWCTVTTPVSLGRALCNNGGQGAAFAYVLEYIDPDTQFHETPHWHVTSEFVRRTRASWQRWNEAANQLEPLSVVD